MLSKTRFLLVSVVLFAAFVFAACAPAATPTEAPVVETTAPAAAEVAPYPQHWIRMILPT